MDFPQQRGRTGHGVRAALVELTVIETRVAGRQGCRATVRLSVEFPFDRDPAAVWQGCVCRLARRCGAQGGEFPC